MSVAGNTLTAIRAVAVLPIGWEIAQREHGLAFVWFSLAALTDLADGWFARRARRSVVGELLDPLADKVLVGGTTLVLALARSIPMELAALIVVREAVVAVARVAAYRAGTHHAAEGYGKAKTALQFVALALVVAAHPDAPAHDTVVALLWGAALLGIVTMPRYRFRG